MLKITRDFYETANGGTAYRWSTTVNDQLLVYEIVNSPWQYQQIPVRVMEQQARQAFEESIFNGAFRE